MCSALKNAYATGLGIFDGLVGKDAHNARAACFTQAVREMSRAALAVGGALETAIGPAGMGDLHVTAAAGRNRLFGECVGAGGTGADVAARMREEGTLTEAPRHPRGAALGGGARARPRAAAARDAPPRRLGGRRRPRGVRGAQARRRLSTALFRPNAGVAPSRRSATTSAT